MKKADWNTTLSTMSYDFLTNTFTPVTLPITLTDEAKSGFLDLKYKGLNLMTSHNEYQTNYFQTAGYLGKWSKNFMNLGYEVKVNDKWMMSLNGTYNFAKLDSDTVPGILRKSHDIVAEWTNHLSITDKLSVVAGGLYNRVRGSEVAQIEEASITVADKSRQNVALYAQVDFWALDNLKLIGGVQANKVGDLDLDVVPRAGVIWYPVEKINIKGLYSQAYRASSVDEFAMDYPGGLKGDKNLKPEKVSSIDLGVNYIGQTVQYGINFFQSKMSNIIAPVYLFDPNDPSAFNMLYMNQGETTFKGVEAEGKFYLSRNLFVTGSLLYQKNESDTAKNVSPVPNFSAKAGVSYKWSKGITVSLFNSYQGKLDDKYAEYEFNINPKQESFTMLDLYFSADLVKLFNMNISQGISVFVQANNLLDKEVWTVDSNTSLSTIPYIQGRSVYAGINFSLR